MHIGCEDYVKIVGVSSMWEIFFVVVVVVVKSVARDVDYVKKARPDDSASTHVLFVDFVQKMIDGNAPGVAADDFAVYFVAVASVPFVASVFFVHLAIAVVVVVVIGFVVEAIVVTVFADAATVVGKTVGTIIAVATVVAIIVGTIAVAATVVAFVVAAVDVREPPPPWRTLGAQKRAVVVYEAVVSLERLRKSSLTIGVPRNDVDVLLLRSSPNRK